ncbi:MAG TPA: DUF4169 family protein [Pseudolabrys sp.]
MAEVVNLRSARKRAQRLQDELHAGANRHAHGVAKNRRKLTAAQRAKAVSDLDQHRIDKEDGR